MPPFGFNGHIPYAPRQIIEIVMPNFAYIAIGGPDNEINRIA
jgi:hypothetical protein